MFRRRAKPVIAIVALASLALAAPLACSFDNDLAAPYTAAPTMAGACGTTETLFPKLLAFLRDDRFAPLRHVIESRLLPTEDNPAPDPSLRTLLGAVVRLIGGLGLERTRLIVDLVRKGDIETKLSPFLVTILEFMDGRLDRRNHYEAADAAAVFVRRCDPDHLLTAVEEILRFESPSHQEPWISAMLEETAPLISEPAFQPFLESFEHEAAKGRPAIIAVLVQVMIFLADDNFAISRVETLLESVVYPVVSADLRARIEVLVAMLEEATMEEAGILEPLQGAVRCGLQHAEARDQLLGFLYDLVATPEVGLDTLIDTGRSVASARAELGLLADVIKVLREDLRIRDDLRELIAILLSKPDVEETVPVLIDLLEGGVAAELLDAVVKLLDGCGRNVDA